MSRNGLLTKCEFTRRPLKQQCAHSAWEVIWWGGTSPLYVYPIHVNDSVHAPKCYPKEGPQPQLNKSEAVCSWRKASRSGYRRARACPEQKEGNQDRQTEPSLRVSWHITATRSTEIRGDRRVSLALGQIRSITQETDSNSLRRMDLTCSTPQGRGAKVSLQTCLQGKGTNSSFRLSRQALRCRTPTHILSSSYARSADSPRTLPPPPERTQVASPAAAGPIAVACTGEIDPSKKRDVPGAHRSRPRKQQTAIRRVVFATTC